MSTITTFSDALRLFVEDYMRGVYSILPAKVIAVDYSVPSVDVKPVVYNVNAAGDSIPIADVLDVPLFIFSADSGNLQISKPYRDWETDRKSTRLNSSHSGESRMPSSA